jgi:hypothetical protein
MSIIDPTFFSGELNIANTDETSVLSVLQMYIDKYEPAYLKILLGETLYTSFVAGLALDPIPAQWTNLKNQLLVVNGTSKVSPIANYVYFYLTRRAQSGSGGALMTQPLFENAVTIDSKIETSRVWNEMNKLSFTVYKFLKANESVYGCLYYNLRFWNSENWMLIWFDWAYWWGWFPFNWRWQIPEIFQPISATGI